VLTGAAALTALVPVAALVAPLAPRTFRLAGLPAVPLQVGVFGLVFVLAGSARLGRFIGSASYLLAVAPEDDRPTYVGLMNTLGTPLVILPGLIGGVIADIVGGYRALFAVAIAASLGAAAMSRKLRRAEHEAEEAATEEEQQIFPAPPPDGEDGEEET
jgi:MFS family permease